MIRTRLTQIASMVLLLGWYVSTSLPASAQILPDTGPLPPAAPSATVAHQHVSLWTYTLVAATAVLVTLAVLAALQWRHPARLSHATAH